MVNPSHKSADEQNNVREQISACITAGNEEKNIRRCLLEAHRRDYEGAYCWAPTRFVHAGDNDHDGVEASLI